MGRKQSVLRIPSEGVVQVWGPITLERASVPQVCDALTDAAMGTGLHARYLPRFKPGKSLCAYEWALPLRGKERGLRAIFYLVTDKETGQLSAFACPGEDWDKGADVLLSRGEFSQIKRFVRKMLRLANRAVGGRAPRRYVVRFLRGAIYTSQGVRVGKHSFRRTVQTKRGWVTPYVIPTRVFTLSEATDRTAEIDAQVRALLELCADTPSWAYPDLPLGEKQVLTHMPTNQEVYALLDKHERFQPHPQIANMDVRRFIRDILQVTRSGALNSDTGTLNALLAYSDGLQVMERRPTLGGIAFFAALASFARTTSCPESHFCSRCDHKVHHQVRGEVAEVVRSLREKVFAGVEWPEEKSEQVLRKFHRKHRSAFVHEARVTFTGSGQHTAGKPLGPSETKVEHPAISFHEALGSVRRLARLAILSRLADIGAAFAEKFEAKRKSFRLTAVEGTAKGRATDRWTSMEIQLRYPTLLTQGK